MTTNKEKKTTEASERQLKEKWGAVTLSNGFTAIPNTLIERQQALKIKPTEMNILLILMKYWWENDRTPYPSKETIAEMINRDPSTVRKAMKSLEEKGLVKRAPRYYEKGGQTSNEYDLSGLVESLKTQSTEIKNLQAKRKSEDGNIRRGGEIKK